MIVFGCKKEEVKKKNDLTLGADLSYVNEMLDCGAKFRFNGEEKDPYALFANRGCQMVRLRLWHSPIFSDYSSLEDVKYAASRASQLGMSILLDIHYSDSWADPGHQIIPRAWLEIEQLSTLGDSVYNYTQKVLLELLDQGIVPEIIQIGNEINTEILKLNEAKEGEQIDWERNSYLIKRGLQAVIDFNTSTSNVVSPMIHIAQPENVQWWFELAELNGISHFDWIGISYYPQWSTVSIENLDEELSSIKKRFNKRIMIVETAYPHTLTDADMATNILGKDAAVENYDVSSEGQLAYLNRLKEIVSKSGAEGIIYWEPAWVSTTCSTLWGQGSHWDNATFFNAENKNEALEAFDFFD